MPNKSLERMRGLRLLEMRTQRAARIAQFWR